jgi:hypothetical protein
MHWLKLSAGLLEKKHREKIGPAVWEFLWLVSKQYPGGAVCRGETVTASRIASDLGTPIATVRRSLTRLEQEQYIRSEAVSGKGNRYFIVKDKRFGQDNNSQETASAPKPPKSETDPRHVPIKDAITRLWLNANPNVPTAPWGPREAGTLATFLTSHKEWPLATILACVDHRFESDTNHSDRPGLWLFKLESYKDGPLDRFKNLKNGTNGNRPQPMVNVLELSRKAERQESSR